MVALHPQFADAAEFRVSFVIRVPSYVLIHDTDDLLDFAGIDDIELFHEVASLIVVEEVNP